MESIFAHIANVAKLEFTFESFGFLDVKKQSIVKYGLLDKKAKKLVLGVIRC